MRTNVRIASAFRPGVGVQVAGEWIVAVDAPPEVAARVSKRIRADLLALQIGMPEHGWRLQARGTQTDWHDWRD